MMQIYIVLFIYEFISQILQVIYILDIPIELLTSQKYKSYDIHDRSDNLI